MKKTLIFFQSLIANLNLRTKNCDFLFEITEEIDKVETVTADKTTTSYGIKCQEYVTVFIFS